MSRPLGKIARSLFSLASMINTLSWFASGNPFAISKHLLRKRGYKSAGKLFRF